MRPSRVTARAGVVTIKSPTATLSLTLGGDAAAKWHKKLEEAPKRLIDKLDVKPGAKVWLWGVGDETLLSQVRERASNVSTGRSATGCHGVFVQVDSEKQPGRTGRAADAIGSDGAVWVHP